jgi:hypothetical protein
MIKHIGYAIQSNEGNVVKSYKDILLFDEDYEAIVKMCAKINGAHHKYGCKVVRVLIDDEVESE